MSKLEMKTVALSLGLFGAVTFVLCVGWGLLLPRFHATPLLEMMLPGFRWLTPGAFVLGLIESFAFGVYVGVVFTPIYNCVARRAGQS